MNMASCYLQIQNLDNILLANVNRQNKVRSFFCSTVFAAIWRTRLYRWVRVGSDASGRLSSKHIAELLILWHLFCNERI